MEKTQHMLERAAKLFGQYSKKEEIYFSSDGQAFFDEGLAKLHARGLAEKELVTIGRLESKASVVDSEDDAEEAAAANAAEEAAAAKAAEEAAAAKAAEEAAAAKAAEEAPAAEAAEAPAPDAAAAPATEAKAKAK